MILFVQGLSAGLRALLCTTQECKEKGAMSLYFLNFLNSMAQDSRLFVYPDTLYNAVVDPFASEAVLTDFVRTVNDFTSWAVPGGDDGLYKQDE